MRSFCLPARFLPWADRLWTKIRQWASLGGRSLRSGDGDLDLRGCGDLIRDFISLRVAHARRHRGGRREQSGEGNSTSNTSSAIRRPTSSRSASLVTFPRLDLSLPVYRPKLAMAANSRLRRRTMQIWVSAVLVRNGSSTHAFDFEQRMIGLSFTAADGALTATAPPNGFIAPP